MKNTTRFAFLASAAAIVGGLLGFLFKSDIPIMLLPVFGLHMELISASTTAAGASGAAAAALSGDSLVVKNSTLWGRIGAMWADMQLAGFVQVAFPSGHDTTRGWKSRVNAGIVQNILAPGVGMSVQPQETISITLGGSVTAGDVETVSLLMLYNKLPGVSQRLISWTNFAKHAQKLTTVDLTLTGAAAGYTGEEAINVDSDLLLPNRDYALMGVSIDSETATVYVKGPDTGNVRIGCPADTLAPDISNDFFLRLSRSFGAALIPVINSGNRSSTLVGFVQDENNISPKVTLYLALLSPAAVPPQV